MATLVFNCNRKYSKEVQYPRIEIFHGDNVDVSAWKHWRYTDIFGRDCVDYKERDKKYNIEIVPEWEELQKGNCPKNLEIDTWEYEVNDKDSEENYHPLSIDRKFIYRDYNKGDFEELVVKIFDIPSFKEMIEFVEKTNITRFVIKKNVGIYITSIRQDACRFVSYDVLTTSMPQINPIKIRWTERFDYRWSRICKGDPSKYAKEITLAELNGENGLHIIGHFGDLSTAYPNCKDVTENWLNGETIDYSKPYLVPEYIKAQRKAEQERQEAYRRERELNKTKDGFCDRCGEPHAEFISDSYRGIHGWLCRDCYNDAYGWE